MQPLETTPMPFKLLALFFLSTAYLPNIEGIPSSFPAECLTSEECYCDYDCHSFNDCCSSVNGSQPVLFPDQGSIDTTCVSYGNIFLENHIRPTDNYVSAITQCPHNRDIDEEIRVNCHEANLDFVAERELNLLQWIQKNILLAVPVIGFADRRVYANVFCAICNGLKRDQVYFSPVKGGCRIDGNDISCLVSTDLPRGLARPCFVKGPRMFKPNVRFVTMENIFLIPDEYLTNEYIKLPFVPNDEEDENLKQYKSSEVSLEKKVEDGANGAYIWFQIILLIFSIIGLTLMLAVYGSNSILRRSLAGLLTMGLATALLAMEVSFLVVAFGVSLADNRGFCVFMAAMLLFSLLSSFMWMMLMAFQLLSTFGNGKHCFVTVWRLITCRWTKKGSAPAHSHAHHLSSSKKRFLKYSLIAILLPICLVLPAVAVNEKVFNLLAPVYANLTYLASNSTLDEVEVKANASDSVFNKTRVEVLGSSLALTDPGFCPDSSHAWFSNLSGLLVWFLVPAGAMITFNFIALLIVCIQICRLSKGVEVFSSPQNERKRERREKSKNLAGICSKLAIILGVSWFVQLFAGWWPHLLVMRRILALVNSAQGGVIAISMLASVKARRALANMLPEAWRGFIAPVSTTTQLNSKERETSGTSKTWTSVLLPKRSRPPRKPESGLNE